MTLQVFRTFRLDHVVKPLRVRAVTVDLHDHEYDRNDPYEMARLLLRVETAVAVHNDTTPARGMEFSQLHKFYLELHKVCSWNPGTQYELCLDEEGENIAYIRKVPQGQPTAVLVGAE